MTRGGWRGGGRPEGYYVVAEQSSEITNREEAFELARQWFPDLEDDEEGV